MSRILMLLQEHYPKDVRVKKEVKALQEMGFTIDIICLKDEGEALEENVQGVTAHRINIEKKRGSKLRYIYEYFAFSISAWLKLKKLMKMYNYNYVHIHTLPDFLVFAAHPLRRKGAKIVLDMHEITPEFFMSKYKIAGNHILIKLLKLIERKALAYADHVITVNHQLMEKFSHRARLRNEITIVMNTVDETVMFKHPKQLSPGKFKAVYHGTLTEVYNLSFAITSLAPIITKMPGFEFHIYGTGADFEHLKKLVEDENLTQYVFLHGRVKHEHIPQVLSECHLGILPQKKDVMLDLSFSNKLAEYVYNEIPVVSTRLAGVMDYFPAEAMYYFESGNAESFQQQVLQVYNNYETAANKAKKAAQLYETISWKVMKERLQKLYSN